MVLERAIHHGGLLSAHLAPPGDATGTRLTILREWRPDNAAGVYFSGCAWLTLDQHCYVPHPGGRHGTGPHFSVHFPIAFAGIRHDSCGPAATGADQPKSSDGWRAGHGERHRARRVARRLQDRGGDATNRSLHDDARRGLVRKLRRPASGPGGTVDHRMRSLRQRQRGFGHSGSARVAREPTRPVDSNENCLGRAPSCPGHRSGARQLCGPLPQGRSRSIDPSLGTAQELPYLRSSWVWSLRQS